MSLYVFLVITLYIVLEGGRLLFLWHRAHSAGQETKPFSHIVDNPQKRVLVIGDSTSYGVGATDPQLSLVGRLATAYPTYSIENASENAMRMERLVEKLSAMQNNYDILIVHIGGIDTMGCTSLQKLETLGAELNTQAKRCAQRVVLVSNNNVGLSPFFHFPVNRFYQYRSQKMFAFFTQMTEHYGFLHIPLYKPPGEDALARNPKLYFSSDCTHPNDDGYALWFADIHEKIKPYMA